MDHGKFLLIMQSKGGIDFSFFSTSEKALLSLLEKKLESAHWYLFVSGEYGNQRDSYRAIKLYKKGTI